MSIIVVTITEEGDQLFLNGHGAEIFCEAGISTVQRASHVWPDSLPLRLAFRALRAIVHDTSALAQWTRTWRCRWRVDTSPVDGPILPDRYNDRMQAIDAEIKFLNQFFFERKL